MSEPTDLPRILAEDLGVQPDYRHVAKLVRPGEPLATGRAVFKWYDLSPASALVPSSIGALARTALTEAALEARGLGMIILHRCGGDFYFLIACTWRNENELWETVYYKDATMAAFAPFPREASHKPTFCVWELVPVWHEQQVWCRFLATERDLAAARNWLADRYAGPA